MGTVTLWCEAGKHNWERERKRGRKPINCPDHADRPETIAVKLPKSNGADPLAKARAIKAERAKLREAEQHEQRKQELKELRKKLPKLTKEYEKALGAATKANSSDDIKRLFDMADRAMNRLMSTNKRVRQLEASVA